MPYIITTLTPTDVFGGFELGNHAKLRRAVATLEEAREGAFAQMAELPSYKLGDAARISDSIHDLPEQGGTVGPLPDGTVIEVQQVEWDTLAQKVRPPFTQDRILDAYNAAQ